MKKLLLIVFILYFFQQSNAQTRDLRCMYSVKYVQESKDGERQINSGIGICYYGNYFSFFTKSTGTITFKTASVTTSKDKDNYVVESFVNEESETNMQGDYDISITYGIKKTVVINFTKFGQAYFAQFDHFMGSPYDNQITKSLITKIGKKQSVNKKAYFPKDVKLWFLENCDSELKKFPFEIRGYLLLNEMGKVIETDIEQTSLPGDFNRNKIDTLFKNMPYWKPATNNKGQNINSQVYIELSNN